MTHNPMRLRWLARAALITGLVSAGALGWEFFRDDGSSVFVPFPPEAAPPVDAPPDSAIDAPPPTDWTMVTIYGPESAVGLNGADGVDVATINGKMTVISPWEQSGQVTVSTLTGTTWSTAILGTAFSNEDAKFCDVDQDGVLDIISGGQGERIRVWLGMASGSRTFIAEADDDTMTAVLHGLVTGDPVKVSNSGGALPAPLSASAQYFVINASANTFKLATTYANAMAGTAINLTSDGTGTQTATNGTTFAGSFEIAAATNIQQWFQFSCTSSGGLKIWAGGRGYKVKTFTASASSDTLTTTSHAFVTADSIKVTNSGGALPSPLVANTYYFVIRIDANTYKLATTRANAIAGTAINLTSDGTGTQTATRHPSVGYFKHAGSPRVPTNYTWVPIHAIHLLVSVIGKDVDGDGDVDVVMSDRFAAAGIKGTNWFERTDPGGVETWTRHAIYTPPQGEGEVKFLELVGSDTVKVVLGSGYNSPPAPNHLKKSVTTDNWATWTTTEVTPYPFQGQTGFAQAPVTCDITGDGIDDTVITHAGAFGSLRGVVALDGATFEAIDIDAASGEKYDDVRCLDMDGDGDLDVLTSEQNGNTGTGSDTGLGVIWFRNPRLF